MKVFTIYVCLCICTIFSVLGQTQMNLPVTFNDPTVNYGVVGFGGAEESTIVTDPTDANNKVVKVVKSNTAELWAGTTISAVEGNLQTGFSSKVPFTETAKTMKVRVWSPDANIPVRLKVEDSTDPTKSVETEARTTVANAWETLSFNFATPAPGTAVMNLANNYNKVSIFFNFGVTGAVAGAKTYYFDDLSFDPTAGGGGTPTNVPSLPLTFESATLEYTFNNFEGGDVTVVANPAPTGSNTSAKVAKMVKGGPAPFAGSFINLATPIDFTTNKIIKLKMHAPRVGVKLLLKAETLTGTPFFEKEVTGTVANAWEELTFDFTGISADNQYQRLVFIFDLGTVGDASPSFTFYFDDVMLAPGGGGGTVDPNQMTLPVTFNEPNITYGVVGFGGAEESAIVTDLTDATNKVVRVMKSNTAELWAGTTVTAVDGSRQTGLSTKVPFTATATKMNVRVWSPDANIPVRLKVEDALDPTKSVETEARTTVANAWQTLTFDFATPAPGTAALNLAHNYNKPSIFFNFGVTGATAGAKTYYFDDLRFGEATLTANNRNLAHQLSFYPNPAQQFVLVNGLQDQAVEAQLFDLTGRALPTIIEKTDGAFKVDVQHLTKGIYILKIQEGRNNYNLKIMKN